MFNLFNKKLKLELQQTKQELQNVQEELQQTRHFLDMFRDTKNAKILIEEAKKECHTKADTNRIKLLEKSIYDINYRSYITKTKSGKICIDFNQIPLSDQEIAELLSR